VRKQALDRRPQGYDYAAEIRRRLGPVHACESDYAGSGSARKPYEVIEGVALIEITGVLVNSAYWYDETEYEDIREECQMAADDAAVKAILLRINSPGGETTMAFETARALAKIGTQKPLWAVCEPFAYSAAYLLAVQASRIYVPSVTGGVGSVGVYGVHMDYSGALEKAGVKPTFLSAGDGKTDGNQLEPLSDAAKKRFQAEIDRLYAEFVAEVADGRKLTAEAVRGLGAALKPAGDAIAAGLADAIGSAEQAWVELASLVAKPDFSFSSMTASAAMTSPREVPRMEGIKKPADAAAGQQQAPVVDNAAARAAAEQAGYSAAAEVADLCCLAGVPAQAAAFLAARATPADVRKALIDQRAAAAEETETPSMTVPKASGAATDQKNNPLIQACAALGAAKGGK
jgi:capsid assembly protease